MWRRDDKELFYLTLDNTLMSVPILLSKEGIGVSAPRLTSWRFGTVTYCSTGCPVGAPPRLSEG